MTNDRDRASPLRGRAATPSGPSQQAVSGIAGIPDAVRSTSATYSEMLPIPSLTRRQMLRFESKVTEDEGGCWLWTGTKNHGRPYFKIGPHGYFAHRVMFAETYGRRGIDASLAVRTCGQRDCVNPDHIVLGDEQTVADARKQYGGYTPWEGRRRGEANPNARFSDEEIIAMFEAPGSLADVAERFGASAGYVWRVKVGRARAQAMSTGTAKTPEAVEGRSPASAVAESDAPNSILPPTDPTGRQP